MENKDLECVSSVRTSKSLRSICEISLRSQDGAGDLLRAWVGAFGRRPATAKDAMMVPSIVNEVEKMTPFGADVCPLAIGAALRKVKNVYTDGMTLISTSKRRGVRLWRVVPYEVPNLESMDETDKAR